MEAKKLAEAPGLPKSLSMRDDPLTKAQAFLTEIPQIE